VQAALDEAMAIYKVDSAAEADVAWAIANANRAGKDLPRVIEAAKQYAAVVERHLDRGIEPADAARAYSELAIQLELATRWPEAIAANQRGLALLERARDGEPQLYFDLLLGLGIVQLENGEATTAIGTFEKAKKLVTAKFPAAADRSALDANLGRAYVAADRPKDAIPLLEPLVEPLRDAGAARRKAFGLVAASLARALWEKGGARDEARDLARDAVTAFSATLDDFKNDPTRAANARLVKGYLDETKKWLEARAK
jgi:tetratricopeptide (TPR) repeat protein